MAQHALDPDHRRVEVDEFLQMDFAGAKAEFEDGNEAHARNAASVIAFLLP